MKKVKLVLTAVVVFAVVGGALAFKAQKFNTTAIYLESSSSAGTCNVAANVTTTDNELTGIATKYRLQSEGTGSCFDRFTTSAE